MSMTVCAYYNEIDPFCVAWLQALMEAELIPGGVIDNRPIQQVQSEDLTGFDQVHLFAGIGGWAYALRLAGWPGDVPVWTGSCPCQPFSTTGKRKGTEDARHLWPDMYRLIASMPEPGAPVVFGEQVASGDGRSWLAGVQLDVEALGFAFGAADLCAAGVGAPHIRQRLYWVAEPEHDTGDARRAAIEPGESIRAAGAGASTEPRRRGDISRMGQPLLARLEGHAGNGNGSNQPGRVAQVAHGSVAAAGGAGIAGSGLELTTRNGRFERGSESGGRGAESRCNAGFWDAYYLVHCLDGKARRIEPGSFPLAHGIPARVGKLRGYGNAVVPEVAAAFVRAYLATLNDFV